MYRRESRAEAGRGQREYWEDWAKIQALGVELAAEKRDFMRVMERRGKAQGLKPDSSIGLIGTTEVVPWLQSALHQIFM